MKKISRLGIKTIALSGCMAMAALSPLCANAQSDPIRPPILKAPKATTYLPEAKMVHPASTMITSRPGLVSMTWDKDVVVNSSDLYFTVNAPGVDNVQLKATYEPVVTTDTGESLSYPYPTVDIDLASLIKNPNNYGAWEITIPEGIVKLGSDVNPEQTIVLTWYKDNDDYIITPSFSFFAEDAPSYSSEELKSVKVTWPGINAVRRNTEVRGAFVSLNGSESRMVDIDNRINASGNSLTFDLSDLDPGRYKLFIPTGYVYLTPASGADQINYEINYQWFSLSAGMSSGTPLPPFSSNGNIPSVSSDVKVMDIQFAGQQLELTGEGSVRLYADMSTDYKEMSVEIPMANLSIQDGDILRVNFSDNVVLNEFFMGPYRLLNISEGVVRNSSGATNPMQNISFKVVETIDVEPTWNPESGSTIDPATDKITLSWPGAGWVNYPANIAYLEGGNISRTVLKESNEGLDIVGEITIGGTRNSEVTFDFSNLKLGDGSYTIVMPEGTFAMETDTSNPVSGAMTYTFKVGEDQPEEPEQPAVELLRQPNSVNPAQGIVPGLSFSNFYWNNVEWDIPVERQIPYTLPSDANAKIHVTVNGQPVEDPVTNVKAINTLISDEVSTSNGPAQLQINYPMDAFNKWIGEIKITIEEGLINTVDGKTTPEIVLTYNVERLFEEFPISDPEAMDQEMPEAYVPLGELEKLTVYWQGLEVAEIRNGARFLLILPATVDDDNNTVEQRVAVTPTLVDGALEFTLGDYTKANGTYTLNISEYAVTFSNGMTNSPYELVYVVVHNTSGIVNMVGAPDGWYTVYDLNGVLVLKTDNAADLNSLGNGLYVVNGKKVLIRK